MPRRVLLIILLAVILGAAVAGGLYWRWSTSPRYSLQQMALALKTRDMNKFFKYMDLKNIFNVFVESASQNQEESKDNQGKKDDEWNRLSRQLGGKFARLLLPKLFESFEKDIRAMMENYLINLDNTQILAVVAAATIAQIEVRGDEAQVTLVDPKSKQPFRFQMRRQPQTGIWQITSVNYQDVKNFSKREFQGP